jgi:hypothetical protein
MSMSMSTSNTTLPPNDDELSAASKILALAAGPALRPVDFLVAESRVTRDPAWIAHAFREVAALDLAPAPSVSVSGSGSGSGSGDPLAWHLHAPPLAEIQAWRARAKFAFEAAEDVHARNTALLVYGWCVAIALTQHQIMPTSQPREDVEQLLAELATVLPEPQATVVRNAMLVEAAVR